MRGKKKALPILKEITILDAGSKGKSIARVDDRVVFVTGVVPGDVCDLQVVKKKQRYYEAKPIFFHELSQQRATPFCQHFGVCGGCKWQDMLYDKQLFYKQKEVNDNFKHLGKFDFPEIEPILGAPKTQFYRNKLEFTFSNKKWLTSNPKDIANEDENMNGLGFHVPGKFDKVVDIEACYLQTESSNQIRDFIKQFAFQNDFSFFDIRNQVGLLRNLIIRTSTTGELMVIVIFHENIQDKIQAMLAAVELKFPVITSLLYIINPKKNDTINDLEVITFSGNDYILEEMEGIQFKIGPKSFYQTNSEQAYNLYKLTREFANLQGNELVYDLYTGTGTIANFAAKHCKQVIGIEYVPEAIEDAKVNSQMNNISNTVFYAGDMKDILNKELIAKHGKPDVIITDPPRAGMHPDVIEVILQAAPQKIVYVSCNPATQARDLDAMKNHYDVVRVKPVDMFPQTHHVENVVLLVKKSTQNL
jgi:23S rRNA (uracil1939-C5)-methyltransferase